MRRAAKALLRRGIDRDTTSYRKSSSPSSIISSTATQGTDARNLDDVPRTIESDKHLPLDSSQRVSNDNGSFDTLEGSKSSTYVSGDEDHDEVYSLANELDGVLNLSDTEDTDKVTTHAPAVTHEHVHPHVQEIKEERIYREIHNYDVCHRIQPVYDVEVLPARHFVPGADGNLVEVSEDELPEVTSTNKKWPLGEKPSYTISSHPKVPVERAKVANEKKYVTTEGVEHTETTIVHPPTLEDMSLVDGPVLPVHFDEHGHGQEMPIRELSKDVEHVQKPHHITLQEAKHNIQHLPSPIPDQLVPPRHASSGKGVGTAEI